MIANYILTHGAVTVRFVWREDVGESRRANTSQRCVQVQIWIRTSSPKEWSTPGRPSLLTSLVGRPLSHRRSRAYTVRQS